MKRSIVFAIVVLSFICTIFTATFAQERKPGSQTRQQAEEFIKGWPGEAKKSATSMIKK